LLLLLGWELLSRTGVIAANVLPAPSSVGVTAWHLTRTGELPRHLWESLRRAAIGLAIGASSGFVLGVLTGFSRLAEAIVDRGVQNPLLLLDEPFAALDALTRERLPEDLRRVRHETGRTSVFVTHSVDEAVFLGSRVVVLSSRPGRVALDLRSGCPIPVSPRTSCAACRNTPRCAPRSATPYAKPPCEKLSRTAPKEAPTMTAALVDLTYPGSDSTTPR
jgi:hypothetical protein